ncbi:Biotin synthase [Suttonella ornithocola]|uniref:Biotin synthase n=2 Tax=Suttonella ornithocola TaxID=279832 RepID=A0A380MQG7_9GAMM|nr:Biotin synthase [Suttonella ornithocola]
MTRWTLAQAREIHDQPFMDLLFQAQQVHRAHHDPNQVQVSTLLSIKTGACPEDCKYCPQSARYQTGVQREALLPLEEILQAARNAKAQGAQRFCMGAAWRDPKPHQMPYLTEVIKQVKALGLETCMTLGMLDAEKAQSLADAGLDYYNHNLDTSREYYQEIITTRTYDDRLETLENVRKAGMKICSGGIMGMGEAEADRLSMLVTLANLPKPPESVPINQLVRVKGTPLAHAEDVDAFDFIRVIATARILMPTSAVRIAAGREFMNEQTQALCFMAGANSVFFGCKLLTAKNADEAGDVALFGKLGINAEWVAAQRALQESLAQATAMGVYQPA